MCFSSLDFDFFVRSGLKKIRLFQSVISLFLKNSNMKNPWQKSVGKYSLTNYPAWEEIWGNSGPYFFHKYSYFRWWPYHCEPPLPFLAEKDVSFPVLFTAWRYVSHTPSLTTGSHNCENHTVIMVFWRNCPGKWPHLLGEAYGHFIFRQSERKTFPATFLPEEVWPLPEGSQSNNML